jgi:hypothetical protein
LACTAFYWPLRLFGIFATVKVENAQRRNANPLDENFSADDFDAEALAKIVADCATFQASTEWQAALEANACGRAILNSQEEMGGHDFWLTRCGHGAGFWDGDWSEPHATALTGLAGKFGEVDILVGDDYKLYI